MKRGWERLTVCGVGAVALATLLLCWIASADAGEHDPSVPAPFATPRLLVAHFLFALPLAIVMCHRWGQCNTIRSLPSGIPVVAALVLTGGVATVSGGLREGMMSMAFGTWASVLRMLIAVSIVAVWTWVGMSVWEARGSAAGGNCEGNSPTADGVASPRVRLGIAAAIAFIPPHCYAQTVIPACAEQAAMALERERLVQAQRWMVRLCELGGEREIAGRLPQQWMKVLREQIRRREQWLQRALPPHASADERLRYAVVLVQLERLAEAESCLQVLCEHNLAATLLLATIYRDQSRWEASDRCYHWALSQLDSGLSQNSAATAQRATIYEGLAYNARAAGHPTAAQQWLEEGLRRCPDQAARFHLLLGQHFADGGRPQAALEHLRAAAALDPAGSGPEAQKLIVSLRRMTPACVLRYRTAP